MNKNEEQKQNKQKMKQRIVYEALLMERATRMVLPCAEKQSINRERRKQNKKKRGKKKKENEVRHKTMKSMKRFKKSQEAIIKVREKRVSIEYTAKQRTEKIEQPPPLIYYVSSRTFPLLTTSNTKLVHLYRAEIYTQYLEVRCLATKRCAD